MRLFGRQGGKGRVGEKAGERGSIVEGERNSFYLYVMGAKMGLRKASAVKMVKMVKSAQETKRPLMRINGHGFGSLGNRLGQSSNDLRQLHQLRTLSVPADQSASPKIQKNCLKLVLKQKLQAQFHHSLTFSPVPTHLSIFIYFFFYSRGVHRNKAKLPIPSSRS